MSNFKIIETGHESPDVLLHRDRNEAGNEVVRILAIGTIDDADDMFAEECVTFSNADSAKRFIQDYSLVSAVKWCEENQISY